MSSISSPGCVLFLIDESAGMATIPGDVGADGRASTKSNSERVATALNSLLNQLTRGPDFDVALIGYRSDSQGVVDVGSRWGGTLAGREFVAVSELAAAPVRVENRVRRVPAADGMGAPREETTAFPIWYVPTLSAKAPQIAAYRYCTEVLSRWVACAGPNSAAPLLVHVFSGTSGDGNPQMVINKMMDRRPPALPPLVFQAHLASNASAIVAEYPSSPMYLTIGSARDVFRRASLLPAELVAALKQARVVANQGAHAMLYNAKMKDLVRMFGLVTTHTRTWPTRLPASVPAATLAPAAPLEVPLAVPLATPASAAPVAVPPAVPVAMLAPVATEPAAVTPPPLPVESGAAETIASPPVAAADESTLDMPMEDLGEPIAETVEPPQAAVAAAEKLGLIILVLDRSVADPFNGNLNNVCSKLQGHANELLKQIANPHTGPVDVAIASYGADAAGQPEVRSTFDGPLAGQTIVRNSELAAGAVRVEEVEEEVSNGIGGLTAVQKKHLIFFDVEPTLPVSPKEAFEAVRAIATRWCDEHPSTCLPPIVLHLTRGVIACDDLMEGIGPSPRGDAGSRAITLYHLIATESPHKSLAYPDNAEVIEDPNLKLLWGVSSPLLGRQRLAAQRPAVKPDAHGFVVNGKFDLLLDEVRTVLNG